MTKINGRKAAETIRQRIDFQSYGALSARWIDSLIGMGNLPDPYATNLVDAIVDSRFAGQSVYVVFSYDTPIAWYSEATKTWHKPDVKYSMTTSHHQGRCPRDGQKG